MKPYNNSNMWEDRVFISRNKEIQEITNDFDAAIDHMLSSRPLNVDPKLLEDEEEEDEEEEEICEEEEDYDMIINREALLLMHEIDMMKNDTSRLMTYFRPKGLQARPLLRKIRENLESLSNFLDNLRYRAECLLSPTQDALT